MVEIHRHQRQHVEAEHAFHFALGSSFEHRIHFGHAGFAAGFEAQIHQRHISGGHADGQAVEFAVELGQHQAHGFGCAGFGGNHIVHTAAGAAQIFMAHIGNGLIVGERVDGGHQAFIDADGVVEGFGDGRQAVGGARSVGNHGHVIGDNVVVDTIYHGGIHIGTAGRRNQHFFRA